MLQVSMYPDAEDQEESPDAISLQYSSLIKQKLYISYIKNWQFVKSDNLMLRMCSIILEILITPRIFF